MSWLTAHAQTVARWLGAWLLAWAGPAPDVSASPCPICGAAWREHRCPYTPVTTGRLCGLCAVPLPADAVRTHDGLWRCREHKGAR